MKKTTARLLTEFLLILAAIAVLIYNVSIGRRIAYMASVVAVIGTMAILAADIVRENGKRK